VVIHNGLALPVTSDSKKVEDFRIAIGIPEKTTLFTLAGRFNRLKGQKLLIDALEQVVRDKRINDIHLLLVGSPPPGQEYFLSDLQAHIQQSSIRDKITLLPFTEDITTVWLASDVAVVPSTEPESFGMVALEAMAASKPVIASRHGGITEIVVDGQTGILFEPNKVAALAKAIDDLLENPDLREQMGCQGKIRYMQRFSIAAYVANFEQIYETIAHT
jgi:glycosyltransferase involved in cell wall biosynthesis